MAGPVTRRGGGGNDVNEPSGPPGTHSPPPSLGDEAARASQPANAPQAQESTALLAQILQSMQQSQQSFQLAMQQQADANRITMQEQSQLLALMLQERDRRPTPSPHHSTSQQDDPLPRQDARAYVDDPGTPLMPRPRPLLPHLQQAQQVSDISTASARRPTVKPDDIGLYEGNPETLEFFRSRVGALVQSRKDSAWEQAIVQTLPLCLRGTAAQWYQLMSIDARQSLSEGWMAWDEALCAAFRPDDGEARAVADARKWVPSSESVQQYFYSKLSLLRSAYPDRSQADLAKEICLGLPESFKLSIRSHLGIVTNVQDMLVEMKAFEAPWRAANKCPLKGMSSVPQVITSATVTPHATEVTVQTSQAAQRSQSAIVNRSATPKRLFSLADTYRPENISYVQRDGKRVRAYKMPHSGNTLYLNRNCGKCMANHFDFEHDHLKGTVKAEPDIFLVQAELALASAYGYTMSIGDTIDVDDTDDSFTSSPDSSFGGSETSTVVSSCDASLSGESQTAKSLN